MNNVLVSVLCLCYNHEKYIRQTLEGFVNQKTDFAFEVLVHDDASTDNTAFIIKEYASRYPDLIKPIFQKENQMSKGISIKKTFLYPHIRGKYVAFCEGDDYWCNESKLQDQYNAAEKYPECSLIVHTVRKIDEDGSPLAGCVKPNTLNVGLIEGDVLIKAFLSGKDSYPFQTSSFFIKKNILLNAPVAGWNGDISMMMYAAFEGNVYYLDKEYSCYRINVPGSYNDRMKTIEYAIKKTKGSIKGYLKFNEITSGRYWNDMKHIVSRLYYQYYHATHDSSIILPEKIDYRKELSLKERILGRLKFKRFFFNLRDKRQKYLRKKY